jgi:hypothetical protein
VVTPDVFARKFRLTPRVEFGLTDFDLDVG